MSSLEKTKSKLLKMRDEKRFSANGNVFFFFLFFFSHTPMQPAPGACSTHLNKVPELEPLFYTSYQYPSQLKFNRFRVLFARNRCIGWCVPPSLDVRTTHMSNISAMALKFFKICHAARRDVDELK